MDTNTINRTENIKYTTYWGDGSGRDGHIVMGNGGLHGMRDYQGSRPRHAFNNFKNTPKQTSIPRKEATAFDYVPDGTGRDSYVIFNYGLKANYRSGYKDFERDLRSSTQTPIMDARQQRRNDPFGTDVSSYNNWPSTSARRQNAQRSNEQRSSIERLSKSPSNKIRPKMIQTMTDPMRPTMSINKTRTHQAQPNVLKFHGEEDGQVQFFQSRNSGASHNQTQDLPSQHSHKKQQLLAIQTSRKNESIAVGLGQSSQIKRALSNRKNSEVLPSKRQHSIAADEDGQDYAPVFRKKMSVPNSNQSVKQQFHKRANSTLQYASQSPMQNAPNQRTLTTAVPNNRAAIRFKKVGNLLTMEQPYQKGTRAQSFNRIAGPTDNLFLRKTQNEQLNTPQKVKQHIDLDQLKQQNSALRDKIAGGRHLPQSQISVVASKEQAAANYADYNRQQSVTAMEKKPKVTITAELRKGLTSELRVKKMGSVVSNPMTAVSNFQTTAHTRMDQTRKSIDRISNNLAGGSQDHEYGSIASPASPIKVGRSNLATIGYKQRNTEFKQQERMNTAGRDSINLANKRSNSVQQQNANNDQSYMMARTAPKGFFKHAAVEVDSPDLRRAD